MNTELESNPAPGYARDPNHRVEVVRGPRRVSVYFAGALLADSSDVLTVEETGYPPVHYFPPEDVRMSLLQPSEHRTYCPFKGTAHYWSALVADRVAVNAAWSYRTPYDEVSDLRDRMAFYADRVRVVEAGAPGGT